MVTLALITLAAILLTGIARYSLAIALDASAAEENLQRRWAELTCQRVLLTNAASIFTPIDPVESKDSPPSLLPTEIRGQLRLGRITLVFCLAAENAKANVNVVADEGGKAKLQQAIRDLSLGDIPISVRLLPNKDSAREFPLSQYESWGQVFALDEEVATHDIPELVMTSTGQLTCWGNGRLDLRRASDGAVSTICGLAVGESVVKQLLKARSEVPDWKLSQLLIELKLPEKELTQLKNLLEENTSCYSLWIRSSSGKRVGYGLFIRDESTDSKKHYWTFIW